MGRPALTYNGRGERRGVFVPPPPPEVLDEDFENLSVANPISAADFRKAVADATYGDHPVQRPLMQVVDLGGAEGRVIRVSYAAEYYTGGSSGIALTGIKLARQVESFSQKYRLRFGVGFETSRGGKIGPGVGGYVSPTTPVSPHGTPSTPPSGGNQTPYGWSVRGEWNIEGKLHEIMYLPLLARYDGVKTYGAGRTLSAPALVKGQFYDYERRITLNTAYETDPNVDPRDLVQGVDYLADGVHEVYIDGVQVYRKTNEVFRLYAGAKAKNLMWTWFRGGDGETWNATAAGSYVDLASHEVYEL